VSAPVQPVRETSQVLYDLTANQEVKTM